MDTDLPDMSEINQLAKLLDDQEREDAEHPEGKYVMDSAAIPTHINHLTSSMIPLPKLARTLTITGSNSQTTHIAKLQLLTSTGKKISLPALCNHEMRNNLLSAQDIAKRIGSILITKNSAIIIDKRPPHTTLGFAPLTKNGYTLNTLPSSPSKTPTEPYGPNAHGTRTIQMPQAPLNNCPTAA